MTCTPTLVQVRLLAGKFCVIIKISIQWRFNLPTRGNLCIMYSYKEIKLHQMHTYITSILLPLQSHGEFCGFMAEKNVIALYCTNFNKGRYSTGRMHIYLFFNLLYMLGYSSSCNYLNLIC